MSQSPGHVPFLWTRLWQKEIFLFESIFFDGIITRFKRFVAYLCSTDLPRRIFMHREQVSCRSQCLPTRKKACTWAIRAPHIYTSTSHQNWESREAPTKHRPKGPRCACLLCPAYPLRAEAPEDQGSRKEETLRGVWRWKYSRSSTSPFRIRGIASEGMARSEHRRSKRNQKKMRDAACYKGEKKPTRK